MLNITVHTDGSCQNPGIGGYGAILVCGNNERIVRGYTKEVTTNNRMELTAVIEAVKWLNRVQKTPCAIEIHTDSKYICDCASHKSKSWFKERANSDLWMELISVGLDGKHKISFVKVKGHSGDTFNERCDKIAKEELAKARHDLIENC